MINEFKRQAAGNAVALAFLDVLLVSWTYGLNCSAQLQTGRCAQRLRPHTKSTALPLENQELHSN